MASTFFRSVRSLEADNSQRSYLGLALAALLLGAWMVWFFLARVSVYAVTNKAELEVDRAAHAVESAVSEPSAIALPASSGCARMSASCSSFSAAATTAASAACKSLISTNGRRDHARSGTHGEYS